MHGCNAVGAAGKEALRYAWFRILKNQEKVGDITNAANKPEPYAHKLVT
jgi:hypothetical protein